MKTKKLTKLFLTLFLLTTMILLLGGNVQAALQSNPSTQYTKTDNLANWVKKIRQMEATEGAMGLSETIGSDQTASSESNNIDVHFMRTTEYGAIAILSASGYGNPSNENAITSTTGNNTGIILNTTNNYWEWTAGITNASSTLSGVNARYYDLYTKDRTTAKAGDALGTASTANPGCAGWHSASKSGWIPNSFGVFQRGNGGIFSFDYANAYDNVVHYGRGIAVCGEGL